MKLYLCNEIVDYCNGKIVDESLALSSLNVDYAMFRPVVMATYWTFSQYLFISRPTLHFCYSLIIFMHVCDLTSQVVIVVYRPTHCVVTLLVYSRSQGLPGRRCLHLERFAGGCDLSSITAGVQTTPEDSSVQPQLSEHTCYLNFVFLLWQWS